ncbi:TPA: hypothetical protein ACTZ3A_001306 [Bacillus cereus]
MNGSFKVVDASTKRVIKIYSYGTVTDTEKNKLRENDKIRMFCCCGKGDIEQRISSDLKIYNAVNGAVHELDCYKHHDYQPIDYKSGWGEEMQDGKIVYTANLGGLIPENKKETILVDDRIGTTSNMGNNASTQKVEGKVTIRGFCTRLNLMTWKKYRYFQAKEKVSIEEFGKKIFTMSSKIQISSKKQFLGDLWFKKSKVKTLHPKKDSLFIYMNYIDYEEKEYGVKVQCVDNFGQKHFFFVEKDVLDDKLKKERVINGTMIISGFVYRKKLNSEVLYLGEFSLFKVNKYGLFSESSHEIEVYEEMTNKGIPFYKPFEGLLEFNDYKADFIIDSTKKIVGEVFGVNTEEYLIDRERKIQLMNNLKDTYDFWYWDAYAGKSMPRIPDEWSK